MKWGEVIVRGPRNLGVPCNDGDGPILGGEMFLFDWKADNLLVIFAFVTENNTMGHMAIQ